jgi:hypothetical protein
MATGFRLTNDDYSAWLTNIEDPYAVFTTWHVLALKAAWHPIGHATVGVRLCIGGYSTVVSTVDYGLGTTQRIDPGGPGPPP